MRRLDVVTTAATPLEDEYGPPEELDAYVRILLQEGRPVPDRFIELTNMWRANNDMPTRDPALIASAPEQFHLRGTEHDHDQQSHAGGGDGKTYEVVHEIAANPAVVETLKRLDGLVRVAAAMVEQDLLGDDIWQGTFRSAFDEVRRTAVRNRSDLGDTFDEIRDTTRSLGDAMAANELTQDVVDQARAAADRVRAANVTEFVETFQLRTPRKVNVVADDTIPDGDVYRLDEPDSPANGARIFAEKGMITAEQATVVLEQVDAAVRASGHWSDGGLDIVVEAGTRFYDGNLLMFRDDVLGWVSTEKPNWLHLSKSLVTGKAPTSDRQRMSAEQQLDDKLVYTTVHEMGHATAYSEAADRGHQILNSTFGQDPITGAMVTMFARHRDSPLMSDYARSADVEMHAEAFAEWVTTGGTTNNPVVRAYAAEFGWRDQQGRTVERDRALAASAGPAPELPTGRRLILIETVDGGEQLYVDWTVEEPEQFHLRGTEHDHDQQSHGGGGSTWTHGGGKRLTVKKSDAKRKMSRREALSASQKIADDVARYFGDTPGTTKAPEPSQWLEQGEVVESDAIDTARADKSGALFVNPSFLDRMADPEFGVADFRVVAHEAVHAYVSGSPYTYEGHSSTYEEGAAELLSLRYWHDQGQPYTDLDAVRPPETAVGTGRWTTDPVDHLAASTVYGDEVIETARRAASAVGGWDDRDAVFAEVERVMRSDSNGRLDFRDSTDPDFALPDGVEHPDSYDTARTLVRYLLAGDVGPFRRRDGEKMSVEFGYDPNQPRVPAGSSEGGQWTDGGGTGRYRGSAAAETERVAALARRGADPAEFDGPVMHRGIAIQVSDELKQRLDNELHSTEHAEDFNRHLHLGPIIAEQLLGFQGHQGIERTGGIGQSWTTRESVAESVFKGPGNNVVVKVTARARQKDIVAQEIEGPDGRSRFVDADGNELQGRHGQPGPGRETDMVGGEMEVRIHGQSPLDIIDVQIATGSGRWTSIWGEDRGYGAGADELKRLYPDLFEPGGLFYDEDKLATRGDLMRSFRMPFGYDPNQPRHPAGSSQGGQWAPSGSGSTGPNFDNLKPLAEPDGGFTLDAAQLRPMTTGWAVAITGSDRLMLAEDAFDADGEPTPELVRLTMDRIEAAKAAQPVDGTELALGGWHNPADGKVEVNVTFVFPADQEARARQFAIDNDQIAMANLDAIAAGDWDNAIVQTGGTGGQRDTDDDRKDR